MPFDQPGDFELVRRLTRAMYNELVEQGSHEIDLDRLAKVAIFTMYRWACEHPEASHNKTVN